jgi:hypothetical protein
VSTAPAGGDVSAFKQVTSPPQTVIVAVGFYVVQWNADALVKFLVIAVCSLVATIGLYDLLVRRTNVTPFPVRDEAHAAAVRARGGSAIRWKRYLSQS